MARWVDGFVVRDVAVVHELFRKCIRDGELYLAAEERTGIRNGPASKMLAEVRDAYRAFNARLRAAAVEGAALAEKAMLERLKKDRLRPSKGGRGLASHVMARPLNIGLTVETGAVGIGDVIELDRAVDRFTRGYGTYWRAIEYGTGVNGVPSQVGRRPVVGSFTDAGGGDATPPDPRWHGEHPVFLTGRNAPPDATGLLRIKKEIAGKHFIQRGALETYPKWKQAVEKVQTQALEDLAGVGLGERPTRA